MNKRLKKKKGNKELLKFVKREVVENCSRWGAFLFPTEHGFDIYMPPETEHVTKIAKMERAKSIHQIAKIYNNYIDTLEERIKQRGFKHESDN